MPQLKPLTQWFCDKCDQVIQKPHDAWVEWVVDTSSKPMTFGDFRIVHHLSALPQDTPFPGCQRRDLPKGYVIGDLPVEDFFSGSYGQAMLLNWLDPGEIIDPKGQQVGNGVIRNMREWTTLFRRLHMPYYEEARRYMSEARNDGYYVDFNEAMPFSEEHLLAVIKEYGA